MKRSYKKNKKLLYISLALISLLVLFINNKAKAQYRIAAYMYEHSNFRGNYLTVNPNSGYTHLGRFNDRISSIRVSRGCRLKIYYDANYMGPDDTFSSGNYTFIGEYFNDRISSAKAYCR